MYYLVLSWVLIFVAREDKNLKTKQEISVKQEAGTLHYVNTRYQTLPVVQRYLVLTNRNPVWFDFYK